jgi:hypothetical protein
VEPCVKCLLHKAAAAGPSAEQSWENLDSISGYTLYNTRGYKCHIWCAFLILYPGWFLCRCSALHTQIPVGGEEAEQREHSEAGIPYEPAAPDLPLERSKSGGIGDVLYIIIRIMPPQRGCRGRPPSIIATHTVLKRC